MRRTLLAGLVAALVLSPGAPAASAGTDARSDAHDVRICLGGCPPDVGPAWSAGARVRLPPAAWRHDCPLEPRGCAPPEKRSLDRRLIQRTVRDHAGQVRWCFQKRLLQRPELAGRVTLRLSIGTDGVVRDAGIDASTADDAAFERCVVERARAWRFPPTVSGEPITIRYPFLLRDFGRAASSGEAPAKPAPESCPFREPTAQEAAESAQLERQIATLPADAPERRAALERLGVLLVARADRVEHQAGEDLEARLVKALESDGPLEDGVGAACEAARDATLGRGLATYEQIAREYPQADDADRTLYVTALLSAELGRTEAAAERLAALLERFPATEHGPRARFLLAGLHFERDRCDAARPLVAAVVAGDEPALGWTLRYRLAWCAIHAGDFAGALDGLTGLIRDLNAPEHHAVKEARFLLGDAEDALLLAWSAAGDPAEAQATLRAIAPKSATKLLARLADRYEEHGEYGASARLYRGLLTASAPLAERLGWWRSLVVAHMRLRDAPSAIRETNAALDVLSEAEVSDDERDAWAETLSDLPAYWLIEAKRTLHPDTVRSARDACELAPDHPEFGSPGGRIQDVGLACAAFLLHDVGDPEATLAYLERLSRGPLTPAREAAAAMTRADARRVQMRCDGDATLPKTDELGERRLTPSEEAFVEAVDREVAIAKEAMPERRGWTIALHAALDAARVHYDRNRWRDAIPRLEAIVRDDPGQGAAKDAAPLLLSACQLACDRACLDRWVPELQPRPGLLSDELTAFAAWWRRSGPADLAAQCP